LPLQTKVHHKWFKQAFICAEGSFPLIALSDTNIVVSLAHVELGEIGCTLEVMDQVVNQRGGIVILVHDNIEGVVVLYKA
jgi:hypothetical protein